MYSKASPGVSHYEIKTAFDLLVKAGLITTIYHTSASGLPMGAQVDPRRFKANPFDVGIYQRMVNLDLSDYRLFYWHREGFSVNAEVDYVIQQGPAIVPVEVKSGTRGSMQSMYRFLDEKKCDRGIRLCMENFSRIGRVDVVPLYAAGNLVRQV